MGGVRWNDEGVRWDGKGVRWDGEGEGGGISAGAAHGTVWGDGSSGEGFGVWGDEWLGGVGWGGEGVRWWDDEGEGDGISAGSAHGTGRQVLSGVDCWCGSLKWWCFGMKSSVGVRLRLGSSSLPLLLLSKTARRAVEVCSWLVVGGAVVVVGERVVENVEEGVIGVGGGVVVTFEIVDVLVEDMVVVVKERAVESVEEGVIGVEGGVVVAFGIVDVFVEDIVVVVEGRVVEVVEEGVVGVKVGVVVVFGVVVVIVEGVVVFVGDGVVENVEVGVVGVEVGEIEI